MSARWRRALVLTGCFLAVRLAAGQDAGTGTGSISTQSEPSRPAATERPGRYRIGPFYLTPRVNVGTIGLDTNVFYTVSERQTDVTGTGGPELDVVLPIGRSLRLEGSANANYIYFVRTESQRRLNFAGDGGLAWDSERTKLSVKHSYGEAFARPSFEIDRRVLTTTEETRAELRRRLWGRMHLTGAGALSRVDTETDAPYLGVDLSRTMSRDSQLIQVGLSYSLTPLSSFDVEAARRVDESAVISRDITWDTLTAGLRTSAYFRGQILLRRFTLRPAKAGTGEDRRYWGADVVLRRRLTPKTAIGVSYLRAVMYSALTGEDEWPVIATETLGADLDKDLFWRFNLTAFGRRTYYRGAGRVAVVVDGATLSGLRDDVIDEAGVNLGLRFRTHLRLGVGLIYTERRSNIGDFGVDGLLAGLTVQYSP
jgi:hypothetical protein